MANFTPQEVRRNVDVDKRLYTAAAVTLTEREHEGRVSAMGATGVAQTLPAATGSGAVYKFVAAATVSSGSHTIVCAGTDEYAGIIYSTDTDTSDTLVAYPAVAGDDYDTITLNGSTKGGLQGDWIELIDIASGVWALRGDVRVTGTQASPLSSA